MLPYREPTILHGYDELVKVLLDAGKSSVLVVTDKGVAGLGLTKELERTLTQSGIKVAVYDGTVANPTTAKLPKIVSAQCARESQRFFILPLRAQDTQSLPGCRTLLSVAPERMS